MLGGVRLYLLRCWNRASPLSNRPSPVIATAAAAAAAATSSTGATVTGAPPRKAGAMVALFRRTAAIRVGLSVAVGAISTIDTATATATATTATATATAIGARLTITAVHRCTRGWWGREAAAVTIALAFGSSSSVLLLLLLLLDGVTSTC